MRAEIGPPKRRRLRMTLRVAMLLVLVAGMWMASVVNSARRQREAVAEIKASGGYIAYDWEYINGRLKQGVEPPGPKWLRSYLAPEYYQKIYHASLICSERNEGRFQDILSRVTSIPGLRTLDLWNAPATEETLTHVANAVDLEALDLFNSRSVSDEGISYLLRLSTYVPHISR